MADNTDIKDEAGEAEDWIEIYNGGEEDIYLGQYYLSDNLQKPDKWLMPDITLPAKSWVSFGLMRMDHRDLDMLILS